MEGGVAAVARRCDVGKERGHETYRSGGRTARRLQGPYEDEHHVCGVALVFAPADLAVGYGLVEPFQVPSSGAPAEAWSTLLPIQVTMQVLGVTLVSLGGLVIAAAAHMRTRLGTRLPGALAAGHALLALAFAHIVLQFPSAPAWATTSVAATFAVGYAVLWIAETRQPGERSPAAGLDGYAQGA